MKLVGVMITSGVCKFLMTLMVFLHRHNVTVITCYKITREKQPQLKGEFLKKAALVRACESLHYCNSVNQLNIAGVTEWALLVLSVTETLPVSTVECISNRKQSVTCS